MGYMTVSLPPKMMKMRDFLKFWSTVDELKKESVWNTDLANLLPDLAVALHWT
jgi:hypothetical protein